MTGALSLKHWNGKDQVVKRVGGTRWCVGHLTLEKTPRVALDQKCVRAVSLELKFGHLSLVLQVQKKSLCCPSAARSEAGAVSLAHWHTDAGRTIDLAQKRKLQLETAVEPTVGWRCLSAGAQWCIAK